MKNRSCVTVFGSCSATLTEGEPLGDVSGSANHDFQTSVTGISSEIDASILHLHLLAEIEVANEIKSGRFVSSANNRTNSVWSYLYSG